MLRCVSFGYTSLLSVIRRIVFVSHFASLENMTVYMCFKFFPRDAWLVQI